MTVLLLSLLPSSATAQQREGQVGIRLVDAPTDRAEDPRAQTFIVDHLNLGATIERRVEVVNTTEQELSVDMYAGAADIRDGSWSPLTGRVENELTKWVSVSPSTLDVPSGGSARTVVRVHVPGDATPGEHYAVVWAEPPAGNTGGVEVVNRVGIRMYLSVGDGGEPPTDFVVDSLTAERDQQAQPVVRVRVANTGGRALDLSGELRLTDGPAGLRAGPFEAERGTTLAPGDEGFMTVLLDPELPSGPWLARMVARSGTLEKAIEATISFPEAAGESAAPVDATEVPLHQDRGFLIPVAGGLLLLALLFLFLVWWRRRRDEEEEAEAPRPAGVGIG